MTPEQREALQKSIEHWEDNVRLAEIGEPPVIGSLACACCRIWIRDFCVGCPVSSVTGKFACRDSPYEEVVNAFRYGGNITLEACILERDWLKLILDSEVDEEE